MKAILFARYGSSDNLALRDLPKPSPKRGEILIRVHASSINSWDWEYLNGTPFINRLMYGLFRPKPGKQVLGADVSGIVESIGDGVTRFKPGDAVFGDLWDSWGGFAEYACAKETSVESKPTNMTFQQAAAVPQAGVLALQGILKATDLQPGNRVLINGAGGGVGSFAVQLAKRLGAEVTGVDAAHKLDVVGSLGADHIIDYAQQDFTKTGERYDLIVDCQNYRSIYDNRRALNTGGTYAMVGGSMLRVCQLWLANLLAPLTSDDRKQCLVAEGPNQGLADLKRLLESDELVPMIDQTFALQEVPKAMRYFGEGRHKGKIVIVMNGE